jgi:hypothetical protein
MLNSTVGDFSNGAMLNTSTLASDFIPLKMFTQEELSI